MTGSYEMSILALYFTNVFIFVACKWLRPFVIYNK